VEILIDMKISYCKLASLFIGNLSKGSDRGKPSTFAKSILAASTGDNTTQIKHKKLIINSTNSMKTFSLGSVVAGIDSPFGNRNS
jgi:hypothetical protein